MYLGTTNLKGEPMLWTTAFSFSVSRLTEELCFLMKDIGSMMIPSCMLFQLYWAWKFDLYVVARIIQAS